MDGTRPWSSLIVILNVLESFPTALQRRDDVLNFFHNQLVTVSTEEAASVFPGLLQSGMIVPLVDSPSTPPDSQPQTVTLPFFLSFPHFLRFHPDFCLAAAPVPSSAPVVLFRRWLCPHHEHGSNNMITPRGAGIPLLIHSLILLLSGEGGFVSIISCQSFSSVSIPADPLRHVAQ